MLAVNQRYFMLIKMIRSKGGGGGGGGGGGHQSVHNGLRLSVDMQSSDALWDVHRKTKKVNIFCDIYHHSPHT